ncbi:MAG: serine/threonine protein kinase [Deltaproteobacteria bacterium]|jgi:serine/threonine-protein kinase|nr:serine/threonine protein kinase [Deltaproteobacteria bacterium]MBW2535472.1 serine/threonine protein kinase [Deltaproteobacteria bacterium]
MYVVAGSMLTESLRIERPLKEGGVGNLWVCQDIAEGKPKAVKFLSEDMVRLSPEALKRFQREAKAAIALRGPHIIETHDFGTMEDGTPYIVMELLEGESLGERLERTGLMSPAHVAAIVEQVADALQTAHDQGLVHRDIKPDNIFLVQNEHDAPGAPPSIKVLDFGTVKQIRQRSDSLLTATGMIVGTPEYMSPEQVFAAKDIDHRADIWGLGAVAYHALTGRLPFEADSPHALVLVIANAELQPPTTVNPQLPPALDGWFARAMARSPTDRFASASETAAAFAEAAGVAGGADDDEGLEDEETLRFQPGIHPDPTLPDPLQPGVARSLGGPVPPPPPSDPRLSVPPAPPSDPRLSVPPAAGAMAPQLTPAASVEAALMAATQPQALGATTLGATTPGAVISPFARRRWLMVGGAIAAGVLLSLIVLVLLLAFDEDEETSEPTAPTAEPTAAESSARADDETAARPAAVTPSDEPAAAGAASSEAIGGGAAGSGDEGGGFVSIDCVPSCNQIVFGGRALGPSPLAKEPLPAGTHEITLKRAGAPDQVVEIEVRADQHVSHRVVAK